jgi:hypothetical protein
MQEPTAELELLGLRFSTPYDVSTVSQHLFSYLLNDALSRDLKMKKKYKIKIKS